MTSKCMRQSHVEGGTCIEVKIVQPALFKVTLYLDILVQNGTSSIVLKRQLACGQVLFQVILPADIVASFDKAVRISIERVCELSKTGVHFDDLRNRVRVPSLSSTFSLPRSSFYRRRTCRTQRGSRSTRRSFSSSKRAPS